MVLHCMSQVDSQGAMIFLPLCGLDVGEGFQFAGEHGAGGATQQLLPSTSPARPAMRCMPLGGAVGIVKGR